MPEEQTRVEKIIAHPRRAVWSLSLPVFFGMVVQYLYNLTDTFFVSRIGGDAIAAMQFNLPFVFFAISICFGLGIGITSLISRALGAKNKRLANNAAEHAVIIGVVLGILISVLSIVFRYPIFRLLGAPENILGLAVQYFEVIVFGFVFNILNEFFRSVLTGEGDVRTPVRFMIIGTIVNVILDPIYIFAFKLGIAGAAWATITAHLVVTLLYIYFFFIRKGSLVQFAFGDFSFSWDILKTIFRVGLPASLAFVVMSLGQMLFNRIVVIFGSDAVAGVGVGMRMDQLFFLPIMACASAMVTLTGMLYGAKRFDLMRSTYLYVIGCGEIIALTLGIFFYLISPYFIRIFSTEPAITSVGIMYVRYNVFAYPFIVIGMISGRVFQGFGKGVPGLIITTIRIAIIVVPLAILFTQVLGWGVQGVFIAQIISSFSAAVIAFTWIRGSMKKIEEKTFISGEIYERATQLSVERIDERST
ncbi:MAG: MATE family efflux transporter [Candidatus Marinimicrobia bacterium]|nr:MATE family efflux transporter [Candidatus Neomarinimicrobiota bacterium]